MTDIFAGLICRPPRKEYSIDELGPQKFKVQSQLCVRRDFEIVNRRQLKLKCSHYLPVSSETLDVPKPVPCVVYLHGNSGSRIDADDMVDQYLTEGLSIFSVDFGGCGMSDGEYVTLGWRERDDLEAVLDYLADCREVSYVALFGRSMGAATALLVAADDRYYHRIKGMVLDSCYTSVREVLLELADKYVGKVPLVPFASMVDKAVDLLKEAVLQKAGFDIDSVNVIQAARHCNAPVLFGHANDDQLVLCSHTRKLFDEYTGSKLINLFDGDHNSIRPKEFQDQAIEFLKKCFADAEREDEEKRKEEAATRRSSQGQLGASSPPSINVGTKDAQTSSVDIKHAKSGPRWGIYVTGLLGVILCVVVTAYLQTSSGMQIMQSLRGLYAPEPAAVQPSQSRMDRWFKRGTGTQ